MYFRFFALSSLIHILYATPSVDPSPIVVTPSGTVQGVTLTTPSGKKVDAFLGIPYAEPPTGDKRFLPPAEVPRWQEIVVADRLPDSCFQFVVEEFKERSGWCISNSNMSEDCLYLNIWVPNSRPSVATAVMVWLHGGGFVVGSSNLDKYDGAVLASEENVIVVSVNYRLNIFGFLKLKGTDVNGNMGLLDQSEALKFIHTHIDSFGGDPRRVTLFGESAGGISVALHLLSPKSKNLFSSAIIQSGTPACMSKLTPPDQLSQHVSKIIESLNCSKTDNNQILDCLRQIKPEVITSHFPKNLMFLFHFGTDGTFLEMDPDILMQQKRFNDVNVLIGTTADDGSVIATWFMGDAFSLRGNTLPSRADSLQMMEKLFPDGGDIVHHTVDYFYTDWLRPHDPVVIRQKMMDLCTDYFITCDTNDLSNHLAEAGRRVYRYEFSHIPSNSNYPKWMGSVHGDEIDFIFGRPFKNENEYSKKEMKLSKKLMRYWANFAKYGNPNEPADPFDRVAPEWPQYTIFGKEYRDLSTNMSTKNGIRDRECAFWSEVFPELKHLSESQKRGQNC